MPPGIPPVMVQDSAPAPGRLIGLYAAAKLFDERRSVVGGVKVRVHGTDGHGLWDDPCQPGVNTKTGGDGDEYVEFPGTAVWSAEECHLVGVTEEEMQAAARQRLARFEPLEVEKFFAPELDARSSAGTSLAAAQTDVLVAGMTPVVHITPESLEGMMAADQIVLSGNRLQTPLGADVAVGAGYAPTLGAGEAIVTGPVTVWRSPIDVYAGLELPKNMRLVVAERGVAVAVQGPVIKIGATP